MKKVKIYLCEYYEYSSKQMVYKIFPSKEQLLDYVLSTNNHCKYNEIETDIDELSKALDYLNSLDLPN